MATKTTKKEVKAVKEEKAVTEIKEEILKYKIEFPDGTISEGTTGLRKFNPNTKNQVINSGFQCKIASGSYSGSIMVIDYLKQERI